MSEPGKSSQSKRDQPVLAASVIATLNPYLVRLILRQNGGSRCHGDRITLLLCKLVLRLKTVVESTIDLTLFRTRRWRILSLGRFDHARGGPQ